VQSILLLTKPIIQGSRLPECRSPQARPSLRFSQGVQRRSRAAPPGLSMPLALTEFHVRARAPAAAACLQEEHPCALHSFDQIAQQAAGKLVAVFLDYDGERTNMVGDRQQAPALGYATSRAAQSAAVLGWATGTAPLRWLLAGDRCGMCCRA